MNNHLPSPVKYREDINGLRTWAVMAVLLFHFSLIGLPGGFAGVDMFFVISGYLMTSIIVGGSEKGTFSIFKFYMSRIRRILPALLVLIFMLLILGWFWLPTPDYQSLGVQSAYSITFLSNLHYWLSTGYFESDSHEKWLLHTWSLAVEAQFYILYPLIITLVLKLWKNIKIVNLTVLLLFIISFIMNLYFVQNSQSLAFYLLPTRCWELASGGLVYLFAKQSFISEIFRKNIYFLGWILIIVSFFLISENLAWPGYWAIFPVLGTSLVILANKEDSIFTDNKIMQWIGDRSYSLYLWHWPIVVALYFTGLQNNWSLVICGFILSILFSHLSYKFIEIPTRQYLTQANMKKEILIIFCASFIIGIASVSVKVFKFENRISPDIEKAANEKNNTYKRKKECFIEVNQNGMPPGCIESPFNKENSLKAIEIGDSHSYATLTSLAQAAQGGIKFWAISSCPTVFNATYRKAHAYGNKNKCSEFNNWVFEQMKNMPSELPLVIVNRTSWYLWGENKKGKESNQPKLFFSKEFISGNNIEFQKEYKSKIVEAACKYQSQRQVYLVRPIPEVGVDVPKTLSKNIMLGISNQDIKIPIDEYYQRNRIIWEAQDEAAEKCGVKILNPIPYLCDDKYCYGSKDNRPLYFDSDHLSEYGNKFLVPMFEEIFKKTLKENNE